MHSIVERLYQWVDRTQDKLLYAFSNIEGDITESYRYGEFLQRTTDIASYLHRRYPMAAGERVLLAYPPGLEMICAFFACVRLGLIPVPVYPPTHHGFRAALYKMNFIAHDCGAAAVLTDRVYFWSMKLNLTRHRVATFSFKRDYVSKLKWIVTNEPQKGGRQDFREAYSPVLFLQYTSGSTSDPKGVMVTHDNILDNCDKVVDHQAVGVSWLPQYHDMGLIGYYLFFALEGGTTYGFSPLDFIRRPALWLETISRYGGSASSAPNFAYEYCLRPGKLPPETFDALDLSSLRFLMTAAEPVRPSVYRGFIETFEPYGLDPKCFFSAYGLAEYTLAVSNYGRTIGAFERGALGRNQARLVTNETGPSDTTQLVSCGAPLGATEVKIVDITGVPRALDDGQVGEVWIRGASKCQGYWQRSELSARIFEARLDGPGAPDEGTWLRSGDLGFMHGGELYLCGRCKDLIIVRGLNYYPQDIELLVEADPHVRKGCVAAFAWDVDGREKLVVMAEVKDSKRRPKAQVINQRIREGLGIVADVLVFLEARTLPKTSSGKLIRHLAREGWLDGTVQSIEEVESSLEGEPSGGEGPPGPATALGPFDSLLQQFGLTGRESCTLADAGLDSIRLVEFSMDLQAHLRGLGKAELARGIDVHVLHEIAICELFGLLEDLASASPQARLRFEHALDKVGRAHQSREEALMRSDAKLRFEFASLEPAPAPFDPASGGILLTGGTGFFGPFLLTSLLEQTDDDVYVLVRAKDEAEGKRRLHDGLASVSGANGVPPGEWARRVIPVCGDLSRPKLGLTNDAWTALSEAVHTIYHNGAMVNYVFDYAAMRDANVGGTNEIIRLAGSHRRKVLNHVSTTFVFGWSVKKTLFETDTNGKMEHLDFGYSQSKWVAEQVVFDAMEQGLVARVFRPALLTPSVDGGGSNLDISIRLLAFMLDHRLGTTAQNQVSFSPADLAADNIVAISQVPDSVGATYHVTRDTYANMLEITEILGEITHRQFTQLALDAFVPAVIERCGKDDILFPLLAFFQRSAGKITAMEFKRYDNRNYRRVRDGARSSKGDPPLRDVVGGILRFMKRQGVFDGGAVDKMGTKKGEV